MRAMSYEGLTMKVLKCSKKNMQLTTESVCTGNVYLYIVQDENLLKSDVHLPPHDYQDQARPIEICYLAAACLVCNMPMRLSFFRFMREFDSQGSFFTLPDGGRSRENSLTMFESLNRRSASKTLTLINLHCQCSVKKGRIESLQCSLLHPQEGL